MRLASHAALDSRANRRNEVELLAWIISQVAPSNSTDIGGIIDGLSKLGVAGIFIWLYLRAETERRKAQDEKTAILEKLIPMVQAATRAMDSVQRVQVQSQPLDPELVKAIQRLNRVTDDLNESTPLRKPPRRQGG